MKTKNLYKIIYYITLLFLLATVIIFMLYFSGFPHKQYLAVVISSALYFILGMMYHVIEGDFHIKIVVEYLLISLLAVIILRGVIFK